MAKRPPPRKPLVVTKGEMVTGGEFYDRLEKKRGTRAPLDEALSMALWASPDDRLMPMARASFEADRALVRKARDDNPLGTNPPSLEVLAACGRLRDIGMAARSQIETTTYVEAETAVRVRSEIGATAAKSRTTITARAVKRMEAVCAGFGWSPDKLLARDKLTSRRKRKVAAEMNKSVHTLNVYLRRWKKTRYAST